MSIASSISLSEPLGVGTVVIITNGIINGVIIGGNRP